MAVHSSDDFYGADRMLQYVLRAAQRVNTSVTVVLPADLPAKEDGLGSQLSLVGEYRVIRTDVPVLRRASSPFGLMRLAWRLLQWVRILRRESPRTVFLATSAVLPLVLACRAAGVPNVILHKQELWRGGAESRALSLLAAWCDKIVCISSPVKEELPGSLAARAEVVLNCVPAPERELPLPDGPGLRFLVASRWNSWKGHATLLAAWEMLGPTDHHLTVLGGPPLSGQVTDVPSLVSALSHPQSVSIVGEVPSIERWIEGAHVVLVPSDLPEPFGLVAAEALVRGRPVVASRAGGLADIVQDGVNGWTFPPGDADALGQVLSELTETDVRRSSSLSRASATLYEPETYIDQMTRLLR